MSRDEDDTNDVIFEVNCSPAKTSKRHTRSFQLIESTYESVGTQTVVDKLPPVTVRKKKSKNNNVEINHLYLKSMSTIMSNGLSSSETLQAIATHDRIMWGQTRILPIELDKELNSAIW